MKKNKFDHLNIETIDLHGLHYNDVKRSLIRKIEMYWNSKIILKIITGNNIKMKNIVTDLLDEYKLNYKIGGNIGINKGMMTVEMEG